MKFRSPIFVLVLVALIALFQSCGREKPTAPKGEEAANLQMGIPIPPPPPLPQELHAKVIIYGDTHTGSGNNSAHQMIISRAMAFHVSHMFHLGDLTESGNDPAEWSQFFNIISPINPYPIEYYAAIGDHDDPATYFANFPGLPSNGGLAHPHYYYVNDNAALFIVLRVSAEGRYHDELTDPAYPEFDFDTQRAWLAQTLQAFAGQNKFRIVLFHGHPMNTNSNGTTTGPGTQFYKPSEYAFDLHDVFVQYGVDAVFMGHSHTYQRWDIDGIPYVVTGGGGGDATTVLPFPPNTGPVEEASGFHYVQMFLPGDQPTGTVTVKSTAGATLDAFTIDKNSPGTTPDGELRIAVYGDTQPGHEVIANPGYPTEEVHRAIVDRIIDFDPKFVFHTGDVVERNSIDQHWDWFHDRNKPITLEPGMFFYPTRGNHDGPPRFTGDFDLPENGPAGHNELVYYVKTDRILFVVMLADGATSAPGGFASQVDWLGDVLQAHQSDDVWKFAYFHVPARSRGEKAPSEVLYPKEYDQHLTDPNYGVDAVFMGHTHAYEHQNLGMGTVPYVVTGGAGATLHSLDGIIPENYFGVSVHNYVEVTIPAVGNTATVKAIQYHIGGGFTQIESFTITKGSGTL